MIDSGQKEIIDSYTLDPFNVGQVKNPSLTKFFKGLKALASGSETTWDSETCLLYTSDAADE